MPAPSEVKIKWEFFMGHHEAPIRGWIIASTDETDDEISVAVERDVMDRIANRIEWEKETVAK